MALAFSWLYNKSNLSGAVYFFAVVACIAWVVFPSIRRPTVNPMARALSNAKLFSAALVYGISAYIARRGYATASQGVASSFAKTGSTRSAVMSKKTGEEMARSTESVSWVPGLSTMLLKNKN